MVQYTAGKTNTKTNFLIRNPVSDRMKEEHYKDTHASIIIKQSTPFLQWVKAYETIKQNIQPEISAATEFKQVLERTSNFEQHRW